MKIVGLSLVLSALPLMAQEATRDTARTAPVIVTATRTPMSQANLPVAVTVITAEDLRLKGITTVADALADLSSAYVAQAGSQGAQTSLFLRGGESKYVKVLIDGVPANDPGGVYDFGSLTTDNIERLEIVRGPASVVHGADAVTGVVNVITRRGRGPANAEVMVRVGIAPRQRLTASAPDPESMTTFDASGGASGELAAGSYSVAIARHTGTGLYELNNRYLNNVLSGRFQVTPVGGTELRLSLRYTDVQFQYPTNGGGTVRDSNAMRSEDRIVLGFEAERSLASAIRAVFAITSSVNDGGTDDQMDAPGGSSFISQDKVRRRGAEVRVHATPVPGSALTFGVQIEQQDQRSQSQSQSSFGPFNSAFRAARRNMGAYGEAVVSRGMFAATVGARVDDNEEFGTFGTARVGASWRPMPATRIRATGGTAFREPSFFENFATGFVVGNPDLRPERTLSYDAGVEQDLLRGRAQLALTGFVQRFADMIDYESTRSACGFSYCNVARATADGVELEGRSHVYGPVHASVAATLLRTKVIEPGYDSSSGGLYRRGESLIRRPERKVTGEVMYRAATGLSASARVLAVGVRQDRDFRSFTPVTLGSYERIDLGAEYVLPLARSQSALTLRVENLADRKYQNVFNFLAPRRTVSAGVRSVF
jgi:vitamin B12 transporter